MRSTEGTVADPPAGYGGVGWSRGNCTTTTGSPASIWCSSRRSCVTASRGPPRRWRFGDGPTRRAFLTRLPGEVINRGTIEVLRNGSKHGTLHLDLFCGTPSVHNPQAQERFGQNRFTVTRQLRYSRDEGQRARGTRAPGWPTN